MKRLLLIIVCLPWVVGVLANPVTADQARQKAAQFFNKRAAKHARAKAPAANALKMMAAGKDDSYYIFNVGDDGGYVVVSGEDATEEILGYSDTGSINPDNMPCGMRMLLDLYTEQIKYLRDNGITREQNRSPNYAPPQSYRLIKRLVSFDQGKPYNDLCPENGNIIGNKHCPTGCVATAMAQLMYYYMWPNHVTNSIPAYKTKNGKHEIDAISSGLAIDWFNILVDYSEHYESVNANAVASLMKYCGASVRMNYDDNGSEASSLSVPYALKQYFGYDNAVFEDASNYSNSNSWYNKLRNEIDKDKPVYYKGYSESEGSHAFLLEGYDGDKFLINFGWGGSHYDTFLLNVVENPFTFTKYQGAIFNVTPKSEVTSVNIAPHLWTDMLVFERDDIYQRSEETGEFQNIPFTLEVTNWVPIEEVVYDLALAIKKDAFPWYGERFSYSQSRTHEVRPTFGSNITNEKIKITLISTESGTNKWDYNDNSQHEYVEAWISGDKLFFRSKEPVPASLRISDFMQINNGNMRVGQPTECTFIVTNDVAPALYDGTLIVQHEETDSVVFIDKINLTGSQPIKMGFTFTPTMSGEQHLVFLNKHWDEVGRQTISAIPANVALNMLEVTNLTLIDGDLDRQLIDGTMLRGKISMKNHDEVTNNSDIVVRLLDVDTQQYKYNTISVNIDPEQTLTYNFRFSNLTDGHAYVISAMYMDNEEFYHSIQLNCTTEGMGEVEPGNEDLVAYEYWFDDNIADCKSIDLNSNNAIVRASINTDGLSYGLHRFNFRVKRSDSNYSSVTSSVFFKHNKEEGGQIVYWFDDNDIDTQAGSASILEIEEPQLVTLDLSDNDKFPLGLHTLNMRIATRGKSLGSIFTTRVLKMSAGKADHIEYWVDDWVNNDGVRSKVKTVTGHEDSTDDNCYIFDTFDLSDVSAGLHCLYYRAASSEGLTNSAVSMTPMLVKPMFRTERDATLTTFRIGVDNETIEVGPLNGKDEQLFSYSLDATGLSFGKHTLKTSFWNSYDVGITELTPFLVVEHPAYIKGDVNGDGDVDLADAVIVINHYVGKPIVTFNAEAADIDGDGVIDLADAVKIINYYVGKIPSLSRKSIPFEKDSQ